MLWPQMHLHFSPLAIPHSNIQQPTSIEVKGAHKNYISSAIIVVAHAPWHLHMPTTTQHARLYHFNKKMLGNPKAQHQFVKLSTYFFMFLKNNSQSFFFNAPLFAHSLVVAGVCYMDINFKWIHLNILKRGWVDFINLLLVMHDVHGKFERLVISLNIFIKKRNIIIIIRN